MTWETGAQVSVRCPRCGKPVKVPVTFEKIDLCRDPYGGVEHYTVRVWFKEQINVNGHHCEPKDDLMPVERFVKHGALDDLGEPPVAAGVELEAETKP